MNSALPLWTRLPMMPTPPSIDRRLDRVGNLARWRRSRGRSSRPARAGRSRCCPPAAGPWHGAAMRSITVARSSDDDRSRPTSASAAVSRARRCVSSKSRAFCSATPIDAATVVRRCTAASSKASSRSKLSSEIDARSLPPISTGTNTARQRGSVPGVVWMPSASIAARSVTTTVGPASNAWISFRSGLYGNAGRCSRLPVLVGVQVVNEIGLLVAPADADVVAAEQLAQLVADDVDDALEVRAPPPCPAGCC